MNQQLAKYAAEVRQFFWDFSLFDELRLGDSLSGTPTVSCSPSGLSFGSPTVTGKQVSCTISGGSAGTTYTVAAVVSTAAGATLEGSGLLVVS